MQRVRRYHSAQEVRRGPTLSSLLEWAHSSSQRQPGWPGPRTAGSLCLPPLGGTRPRTSGESDEARVSCARASSRRHAFALRIYDIQTFFRVHIYFTVEYRGVLEISLWRGPALGGPPTYRYRNPHLRLLLRERVYIRATFGMKFYVDPE